MPRRWHANCTYMYIMYMKTLNPESDYGNPRRLIDDDTLSFEEKMEILESWRDDLQQRQRADEENMARIGDEPGGGAGRLADVMRAIEELRDGPAQSRALHGKTRL